MLLSPRFLSWLGFFAWGLALFTLAMPDAVSHAAVVELGPCISCSENALQGMHSITLTTFAGFVCGMAVAGIPCDRYGRFRTLLGTMCLASVSTVLDGLAFHPGDFLLFRFLNSAASGGIILSSMILIFEASPDSDRPRLFAMAFFGALSGIFLSAFLWFFVQRISFLLPYVSWRNFLILHVIPLPFVFLLSKYHDESMDWKTDVRDTGRKIPFSAEFLRLSSSFRFRPFLFAILSGVLVFGGIIGVFQEGNRQIRERIRGKDRELSARSVDMYCVCALLRYLVSYPALLDAKELEPFELSVLPEMLRSPWLPEREPCGSLAEAIRELHGEGKPIDMDSVAEKAVVRWNCRFHENRAAGEIPLDEIEEFRRSSRACFERGADILDAKNILDEEKDFSTRSELWRARKETLIVLYQDVRNFLEKRFTQCDTVRSFFTLLFLLGAAVGATLVFRVEKFSAFGISVVVFVFILPFSSARLFFDRYLHEMSTFLPATGAFGLGGVLPLLLVPCLVSLPGLFRPAVRATFCGMGIASGMGIACLIFRIVPESYHGILIMILFGSALGCYLFNGTNASRKRP